MKKYFYEIMTDTRHGLLDKAVAGLLWVLSLVYGLIVGTTRFLYQIRILPVYESSKPVISVGNITTGGTGKTPLVIWLVKVLKQKGIKVVVLSRGYGSLDGSNDEIKMFQELLPDVPVLVGPDRGKNIQKALSHGEMDLFVADDAFSHWPLKKNLDIVIIDAVNPFGNGHLLPRGILRENVSALKRADIFVLSKTDQAQTIKEIHQKLEDIKPGVLIVESTHKAVNFQDVATSKICSLEEFKGKKVVAFCAIGQPSSFEDSLKDSGLQAIKNFSFMDHHLYALTDIKVMIDYARKENINILVTTHKDAVKISAFKDLLKDFTVLQLNMELTITQKENQLVERIISL